MALTAAAMRELEGHNVTDDRIALEELRQRAQMQKQTAAHLEDLRREMVTPLKSFWLRGEDLRPLRR